MEANTIGVFVQPGAVIAGIVPASETPPVDDQASSKDVAFIQANEFSILGGIGGQGSQRVRGQFGSCQHRRTLLSGAGHHGPSHAREQGKSYAIIPGMNCSAEIVTGRKTILHYLLKPFNKARDEALREA